VSVPKNLVDDEARRAELEQRTRCQTHFKPLDGRGHCPLCETPAQPPAPKVLPPARETRRLQDRAVKLAEKVACLEEAERLMASGIRVEEACRQAGLSGRSELCRLRKRALTSTIHRRKVPEREKMIVVVLRMVPPATNEEVADILEAIGEKRPADTTVARAFDRARLGPGERAALQIITRSAVMPVSDPATPVAPFFGNDPDDFRRAADVLERVARLDPTHPVRKYFRPPEVGEASMIDRSELRRNAEQEASKVDARLPPRQRKNGRPSYPELLAGCGCPGWRLGRWPGRKLPT
jgi:hypothetical protein